MARFKTEVKRWVGETKECPSGVAKMSDLRLCACAHAGLVGRGILLGPSNGPLALFVLVPSHIHHDALVDKRIITITMQVLLRLTWPCKLSMLCLIG